MAKVPGFEQLVQWDARHRSAELLDLLDHATQFGLSRSCFRGGGGRTASAASIMPSVWRADLSHSSPLRSLVLLVNMERNVPDALTAASTECYHHESRPQQNR